MTFPGPTQNDKRINKNGIIRIQKLVSRGRMTDPGREASRDNIMCDCDTEASLVSRGRRRIQDGRLREICTTVIQDHLVDNGVTSVDVRYGRRRNRLENGVGRRRWWWCWCWASSLCCDWHSSWIVPSFADGTRVHLLVALDISFRRLGVLRLSPIHGAHHRS